MFLEAIDVPLSALDYQETIRVIEDYKQLDVEAATMALALLPRHPRALSRLEVPGGRRRRRREPEGLPDRGELGADDPQRLNNLMLYQEGWGVETIKHSLTYSGGQSRGHVRTYAPARVLGFQGFSPYALAQCDRGGRRNSVH